MLRSQLFERLLPFTVFQFWADAELVSSPLFYCRWAWQLSSFWGWGIEPGSQTIFKRIHALSQGRSVVTFWPDCGVARCWVRVDCNDPSHAPDLAVWTDCGCGNVSGAVLHRI